MALEIIAEFTVKEEASAFQKFLRANKCSSRLVAQPFGYVKVYYEGTVAAYHAMIPKIRDHLRAILSDDEEVDLAVADYCNKIKRDANFIKELYATYEVGDILKTDEMPSLKIPEMDTEIQEFINGTTRPEYILKVPDTLTGPLLDRLEEFHENEETYRHRQELKIMLAKDGVLRGLDDGTYRMEEKMPIDEVELLHSDEFFAPFDDIDTLTLNGFTETMINFRNYAYSVTTGPEVVLIDEEKFEDYMRNARYIKSDTDELRHTFVANRHLVQHIQELAKTGHTTVDKLDRIINHSAIRIRNMNGRPLNVRFMLFDPYLKEIVADMKKLHLLPPDFGKR